MFSLTINIGVGQGLNSAIGGAPAPLSLPKVLVAKETNDIGWSSGQSSRSIAFHRVNTNDGSSDTLTVTVQGRILASATDYATRRSIIVTSTGTVSAPTLYFYKLTKSGVTLLKTIQQSDGSGPNSPTNFKYQNGLFMWWTTYSSVSIKGRFVDFDSLYNGAPNIIEIPTSTNSVTGALYRWYDPVNGENGVFHATANPSSSSNGGPFVMYDYQGNYIRDCPNSGNNWKDSTIGNHKYSIYDSVNDCLTHVTCTVGGQMKCTYNDNTTSSWTYQMYLADAVFVKAPGYRDSVFGIRANGWDTIPYPLLPSSNATSTPASFLTGDGSGSNSLYYNYGHVSAATGTGYVQGNVYWAHSMLDNIDWAPISKDLDQFKVDYTTPELYCWLDSNSYMRISKNGVGSNHSINSNGYSVTGNDCTGYSPTKGVFFVEA